MPALTAAFMLVLAWDVPMSLLLCVSRGPPFRRAPEPSSLLFFSLSSGGRFPDIPVNLYSSLYHEEVVRDISYEHSSLGNRSMGARSEELIMRFSVPGVMASRYHSVNLAMMLFAALVYCHHSTSVCSACIHDVWNCRSVPQLIDVVRRALCENV